MLTWHALASMMVAQCAWGCGSDSNDTSLREMARSVNMGSGFKGVWLEL